MSTTDYFDSSALVKRYLDDLPPLILVAADHDLLEAAQAEGLRVEDPNQYS